jgi:hypothetical protein
MKQRCFTNEPDTALKFAFRRDIEILLHQLLPANGVRRCVYRTGAQHAGGGFRPAHAQYHQASGNNGLLSSGPAHAPGTELEDHVSAAQTSGFKPIAYRQGRENDRETL